MFGWLALWILLLSLSGHGELDALSRLKICCPSWYESRWHGRLLSHSIPACPEGRPGVSDVFPQSGISGPSFDSSFLSSLHPFSCSPDDSWLVVSSQKTLFIHCRAIQLNWGLLTPSLPEPVKFPGWKMHGRSYKQHIFQYYSTCTLMKILSHASTKKKTRVSDFALSLVIFK